MVINTISFVTVRPCLKNLLGPIQRNLSNNSMAIIPKANISIAAWILGLNSYPSTAGFSTRANKRSMMLAIKSN